MVRKPIMKTKNTTQTTSEITIDTTHKTVDLQLTDNNAVDVNTNRRQFFKQVMAGTFGAAAAFNILPIGLQNMAYAAGSDAPEITEVKVGFIPLTDSAPIIMAAEMGFDKKYGI